LAILGAGFDLPTERYTPLTIGRNIKIKVLKTANVIAEPRLAVRKIGFVIGEEYAETHL
jgi:hypothetical protein